MAIQPTAARPRWEFRLELAKNASRPLFLQIATAIVNDILRGRLRPGDPLPGTRALARSLCVNRVTVLTAYEELTAEGWIATERGRGAHVSRSLPETVQRRAAADSTPGLPSPLYPLPTPFDVPPRWCEVEGVLSLNSSPDVSLLHTEPLARAYRRHLRRDRGKLLAYGSAQGHQALRAAVAELLSTSRGMSATDEEILITRGSQMALSLAARALLRPGDAVAVEGIGYPRAWQAFRLAGATVVPVRVDGQGIDVSGLARIAAARRISAVYVTPHHQFPTTVTLSPGRRVQLLDLARTHRFVIIEDDYDDAFHYQGRPVLPLASLDRAGVVLYVGTFSKIFAPGIRLGYVAAPRPIIERLTHCREFTDVQGDLVLEAAVAELLEDAEIQRHVRRVKRLYLARRDLLADLLHRSFGSALTFTVPSGGVAFWVQVADGIDVEAWRRRCVAQGVSFLTAQSFSFDRRARPFARFGFASLNEENLSHVVGKLLSALPPRTVRPRFGRRRA